MKNKYRTHECNNLYRHIGEQVKISGWIHNKRNHGKLCFIDLRDHTGIIQIICSKQNNYLSSDKLKKLISLNCESVISIIGVISKKKQKTSTITLEQQVEMIPQDFTIISTSEILPFNTNTKDGHFKTNEELRLKYRFLDLRRKKIHKNIILRGEIIQFLRKQMLTLGFSEFQTPILTSSSPEGARDFIIPSRIESGKFYALPQAPQQFKQLLMMSGFHKYFQIAPCFRDENARADRAPGEFYQLDIEMSFAERKDIFKITESVLINTFKKFSNWEIEHNFPKISYDDAMIKYGTDKPDLRNDIVISDGTKFDANIFDLKNNVEYAVRTIPVNFTYSKTSINTNICYDIKSTAIKQLKIDNLFYINFNNNKVNQQNIPVTLHETLINKLKNDNKINEQGAIFFVYEKKDNINQIAGKIRNIIANKLHLNKKNIYKFCWITDYPMYELDKKDKTIKFKHNPFSMPQDNIMDLQRKSHDNIKKLTIKAEQYDVVCNGIEISSGAIRNHNLDSLYQIFKIAGYDESKVNKNFPAIIKGLKYGCPPHGGIAPGIDRIVMMITQEQNIREVIAFPMNQNGHDLLMNAPSHINDETLQELKIRKI